jgi:transcriptional regulator GlxA family with amidase domain
MKNITILVPESSVVEGIADPRYMFTAVNDFLRAEGKQPMFNVQLAGLTREVQLLNGSFRICTDALLDEAAKPDLIIIPSFNGVMNDWISRNKAFIPWIVAQYREGAEVASLCSGAFLLAATGLLDGKQASTHWIYANQFRTMFPKTTLVDDRIVTDEDRLYTSGGANAYWNLLLHLVEKYTDRHIAILAAKFFVLDIDRNSQSPFRIFKGQKIHEDEEIKRIQDYIESNFHERFTVDHLCSHFGIARRTFERRFKKATNNSVNEYMQRVKIEAAKKQLETGRKTVSEVMYDVGYTDTKAFRDLFKKITAMSPISYRNKYNRDAVSQE